MIEARIYDLLSNDQTLQELLAPDTQPPRYQIGVYNQVAPYTDSRSKKPPQLPFITYAPVTSTTDRTVCDFGYLVAMTYRITVWDSESGATSMLRAYQIMDRIQTLLDRTQNASGSIYGTIESVIPVVDVSRDGRTDAGVSAMFDMKYME